MHVRMYVCMYAGIMRIMHMDDTSTCMCVCTRGMGGIAKSFHWLLSFGYVLKGGGVREGRWEGAEGTLLCTSRATVPFKVHFLTN